SLERLDPRLPGHCRILRPHIGCLRRTAISPLRGNEGSVLTIDLNPVSVWSLVLIRAQWGQSTGDIRTATHIETGGVLTARVGGGWKPVLGNHSVDTVFPAGVRAGKEKLEVLPSAKSDGHRVRNITGSSGVPVRQQLPLLVHSVDAVFTAQVRAGKEKLEVLPSAKSDGHRVRNITGSSRVPVRQQMPIVVHSVDAVLTANVRAGKEQLEGLASAAT